MNDHRRLTCVVPSGIASACHARPRADDVVEYVVELTNTGHEALDFDCYAAVLTGLRGATAYLPVHGGAVLPVQDADYTVHNLGGLTIPAAVLHQPDNTGFVIAQEKMPADEARYRTGLLVHGRGLPARHIKEVKGVAMSLVDTQAGQAREDLGGVAAFVESLVLASGEKAQLGPYLVAPYRGTWLDGAALLRKIRRPRTLRPWTAPLNLGAICVWHRTMEKFADYPVFAAKQREVGADIIAMIQWNWLPKRDPSFWWAYSLHCPADEHLGGDAALKQAIAEARRQGTETLLYSSFATVGVDGPLAPMFREKNWYMLCEPGRTDPAVEYGGCGYFYPPCVGLPEVREWIVTGLCDLMKKYEPVGLFLDEPAAIGYRPCYNPAHRHDHPYVWTHGVAEILREFRRRCPDAVVTLEGSSELLRESVDGYYCHSHAFTGHRHTAPVTRAIAEGINIFDSSHNAPVPATGAAYHFAGGARYYTDRVHATALAAHQRYRVAYPELFSGELLPVLPRFDLPQLAGCAYTPVIGYLFRDGGKTVLTVAKTGGEVEEHFVTVTLPFTARELHDRVTGERLPVGARLVIRAWEVRAWEVIT